VKNTLDLNVVRYHNKALFFIMLVLLGIDSQFAMVDVLVAAALDEYPHIFRKGLSDFFSLNRIFAASLNFLRTSQNYGRWFLLSSWFSSWNSYFDEWRISLVQFDQ